MGPLLRDLPSSMLKMLKPDEAEEAVKILRKEGDVPKSKKRILIKQLMSGGNNSELRIREFGDFVSEFPIRQLKKINNVEEILPVDSSNNSTDSDNETDAGAPHWRAVQARALLGDIVMKQENWGPVSELSGNWELKNIKKLGRLALGLKRSDIEKLSIDSFTDFVAEFSQISNWTLGQAKIIAKRFIKAHRDNDMTVTDMASLGDFVIHIIDELFASLSEGTLREAARVIGTSRQSRRLPKPARRRKAQIVLAILGKKASTINSEELEELGYLVSGFTPDEIKQIEPTVFIDAVATLGDIEELDEETSIALANKAVEVFGGADQFDGDVLHDLGHIVEGLDGSDIAKIPANVVQENIHVFAEADLDSQKAAAVLEKTESASRKRRAVDMSSKTASELIAMGSTLLALTPNEILSIANDTFLDAVAEISEIKGFSTDQLQAWASKATWAMGTPSQMTEDQLLTLNEFAKGFSSDELSQMSFTSNDVIESFGNVRGYTSEQVAKLWETIKGGKSMASFTGDDLVALGVIASGMTSVEIKDLDVVAYQDAALELGQLDEWSTEQLVAIKEKAVASFGATSSWTPTEISQVGAVIGSFTADEIKSITADQLDAITAASLKHIPPEIFKEFSVEQLTAMSGEQVAAISDEQKAGLTSSQRNVINAIENATLGYTSGSSSVKWSIIITVTFLVSQFIRQFV
ncbi:putative stereocilin-like protein [Dendronephthya gigantea]|uniref:putative stereocilin-like protein n=1 Tax=Dendronephthya gigantea TaxID=151771 RepID=UPI00106B9447|nr:putative stereocilin-like protein [Dendronephthya gigantea]